MTAQEAVQLIQAAICEADEEDFEDTVEQRAAEGWANPTLQAQNEWQGNDNGVVFGSFDEAVRDLEEYGEVPTGINTYDPETDGSPSEYLLTALGCDSSVGRGRPVAFVGVAGYFTLIRDGATADEVADAAVACLPGE